MGFETGEGFGADLGLVDVEFYEVEEAGELLQTGVGDGRVRKAKHFELFELFQFLKRLSVIAVPERSSSSRQGRAGGASFGATRSVILVLTSVNCFKLGSGPRFSIPVSVMGV